MHGTRELFRIVGRVLRSRGLWWRCHSGRVIRLDLEVIDHGADNQLGGGDDVLYRGNFFTEDQGNFDDSLYLFDANMPERPGEDSNGNEVMDESEFSLPVFTAIRDSTSRRRHAPGLAPLQPANSDSSV